MPTPITTHGGYLCKRDDLFSCCAAGDTPRGAKARACRAIWDVGYAADIHRPGVVTCGGRGSHQITIVAQWAAKAALQCRVHTASGPMTPELEECKRWGAGIIQHKPGYTSVICARAAEDALATGACLIPWGMAHATAVRVAADEVASLAPYIKDIKRIVITCGSGINTAGLLTGLFEQGWTMPVIGVRVGGDPLSNLTKFGPPGWREQFRPVVSKHAYTKAINASIGDVKLDPYYEAKALEFLRPGDLFWIIGCR